MIGEYNKSVILTYLGICISILGIWNTVLGEYKYAFICLILAGICDLFDGVIARKCKRSERAKAFGIQLDSLADVFSFLAFPAVIAFTMLGNLGFVAIPYVLAGIIRLAWFNVITEEEGADEYFQGLPVTYSALILPVYYMLYEINPEYFDKTGFVPIFIIIAAAYVINFKMKKPRGLAYLFFGVLAIGVGLTIALS